MQPEVDIKHVQKGTPEAGIKQTTPAEQWDQVAFQLIRQELAPDGFKKIMSGYHRGLTIAKSKEPGITTHHYKACQRIAAQMVRTYRARAKARIKTIITEIDAWVKEDQKKLAACRFWELRKKAELKYKIRSLLGQGGSASRLLHELDNIGIK